MVPVPLKGVFLDWFFVPCLNEGCSEAQCPNGKGVHLVLGHLFLIFQGRTFRALRSLLNDYAFFGTPLKTGGRGFCLVKACFEQLCVGSVLFT